jgi:hypothetical protein
MARLTSPPTTQMVREMLIKSRELPGSVVQILFGNDGSQEYSLSACSILEADVAVCSWTLSRGDDAASAIDWTYDGDDADQVSSYITTRFPGWSQQSKLITPEIQAVKTKLRSVVVARSSQRSSLEGDLKDMPVTNLLQSVAMNKMNGRLEIRDGSNEATVWFAQGAPVDCELPGAFGDDALIELVCWETGEFHFFPESEIERRTVKKRLEILIMEGAIFHCLHNALSKLDFSFDSTLYLKNEAMTEAEFDQVAGCGIPVDLILQKQIFCSLKPKVPVFELMQSLKLSKIQVVPIVFNLLSLDVVALSNERPVHQVKRKAEALAAPASKKSRSMNSVEETSQTQAKKSAKENGIASFLFGSLFHPLLLLVVVLVTCLYLQGFRIGESKIHSKSTSSTSQPVLDKKQHILQAMDSLKDVLKQFGF